MRKEGLEWTLFDTPLNLEEVTAPTIIPNNTLKLYAKDKASISALYYMDDAEVEHDLSGGLTGSGSADQVAFWTAATVLSGDAGLIYKSATDRLGIGSASSPDSGLHIKKAGGHAVSVDGESLARFEGTSSYAGISIGSVSGQNSFVEFLEGTAKKAGVEWVSGSNRLEISSATSEGDVLIESTSHSTKGFVLVDPGADGFVGIGTPLPTAFVECERNATDGFSQWLVINTASGGFSAISCMQDFSQGVGDANNFFGLSLSNTGSFNGHLLNIPDSGVLQTGLEASNGMVILTQANAPIRFATNGYTFADEQMRITGGGYVGIGLTNPYTPLHVKRNAADLITQIVDENATSGGGSGFIATADLTEGDQDAEEFVSMRYQNLGGSDITIAFLSNQGYISTGTQVLNGMSIGTEYGPIRFFSHGNPTGAEWVPFSSERFRVGELGQWGIGGSATITYPTSNFGLLGKVVTSGGIAAPPTWSYPDSQYFIGTNWTDLTDAGDSTLHYHASDRDSANFTGTNWTDLTDGGATTLHKHDHGGQDGLGDDDHTQYVMVSSRAGDLVDFSARTTNPHFKAATDNTDPTGGGGAATGRIPIDIGGATKYIAYY